MPVLPLGVRGVEVAGSSQRYLGEYARTDVLPQRSFPPGTLRRNRVSQDVCLLRRMHTRNTGQEERIMLPIIQDANASSSSEIISRWSFLLAPARGCVRQYIANSHPWSRQYCGVSLHRVDDTSATLQFVGVDRLRLSTLKSPTIRKPCPS